MWAARDAERAGPEIFAPCRQRCILATSTNAGSKGSSRYYNWWFPKIRVPQYRPPNTIILIIGTPKKVPTILGIPQLLLLTVLFLNTTLSLLSLLLLLLLFLLLLLLLFPRSPPLGHLPWASCTWASFANIGAAASPSCSTGFMVRTLAL